MVRIKKQGEAYFIHVNGDPRYKCLNRESAHLIIDMIDALISAQEDIGDFFKKYGEPTQSITYNKIQEVLKKLEE